jgi:hypothetical protein
MLCDEVRSAARRKDKPGHLGFVRRLAYSNDRFWSNRGLLGWCNSYESDGRETRSQKERDLSGNRSETARTQQLGVPHNLGDLGHDGIGIGLQAYSRSRNRSRVSFSCT